LSLAFRAQARQYRGTMGSTPLSSLDASFLRVETPSAHMHVAWKGLFAGREDGTRPDVALLRRSIGARLPLAERFRQRLAFPVGGLGEPVWVDDAAFDIDRHVAALAPVDGVLTRARFDELCDVVLSEPLPRDRPLWQMLLAPRLENGDVGLLMKIHHAMVDGMSAVALGLLLLDLVPDAAVPESPGPAWEPAPAPGAARLALDALARRSYEPLRAARGLAGVATSPRQSVRLAGTLRRAAMAVGEDVLRPAPSSMVNLPIGPRRVLAHHTTPLEPMLAARTRLGATLNDVALGVAAGAMRALALQAGNVPEPLKVMVPVSRREQDDPAVSGNRISFVFIELPLHLHRAAERVEHIRLQTERFKRTGRAQGTETLLSAIGLLPDAFKDAAARMATSSRMYNLTVSHVRLPPALRGPVYLLGCRLREAAPVIPIPEGHALSIGIFTTGDVMTFGAYADPDSLPEIDGMAHALERAAIEIVSPRRRALARRSSAATSAPAHSPVRAA
jgi:diacylglycerol O-acyltransferase